MTRKPFPQSFWVQEGVFCAGCYPGHQDPAMRDAKLRGLLDCGIQRVLSLMEPTEKGRGGVEFLPYAPRLRELARGRGAVLEFLNLPIRDASAPDASRMREILTTIEDALREGAPLYVHCWGGHGRTSTVVACHLMQHGHSAEDAIRAVMEWRAPLPKSHYPFEGSQEEFVRSWTPGG